MNLLGALVDPKSVELAQHPRTWLESHGVNILIIVVGAWLLRWLGSALITSILNKAIRSHPFATETDRKKRVDTLDSLVTAVSRVLVWVVAIIMIVDELGINTAPLLASAGVVGVALGIGAQSLIKDFVNGLFIILENQYRVGDYVQFGLTEGVVQAVTIRTTILRDMNGNIHHVPNSSIIVATNMTFGHSGINLDLTVGMKTDLAKMEKIVNEAGKAMADSETWGKKIKRAPYFAQIVQFSGNNLVVKILGETVPGAQWKVRTELIKRLRTAFDKNNIKLTATPAAGVAAQPATKAKK